MVKPIIKLIEHASVSSDDVPPFIDEYEQNSISLKDLDFSSDGDIKLATALQEKKIMKFERLKSGLKISPSSYVGTVEFSKFIVHVFPKTFLQKSNLKKILDYVWELKPDIEFLESRIPYEEETDNILLEIIIRFFVDECKEILKKGLLKSYVTHEENVSFMRGKLLLKQHISNIMKNNVKFACQFDELEHNNLENKLLLSTLRESYVLTNTADVKQEIRKLMHQFTGLVDDVTVSVFDFEKISYNRLNQHYETSHNLAKLIISATGIREYSELKKIRLKPFFIDMNDVFEKFVEKLLTTYFARDKRYKVISQKSKPSWKSVLDGDMSIRTDVLVEDVKSKKKFIVDTKYKKELTPQDRYQIGFYVLEYSQPSGTAVLPKYPDSQEDDVITSIVHEIQIMVKRIDVDRILYHIYDKPSTENLFAEIKKIIPSDMQIA